MTRKQKLLVVVLGVVSAMSISCRTSVATREHGGSQNRNRFDEIHFPNQILWAWERPEELASLVRHKISRATPPPHQFAPAFPAQTLVLKTDNADNKPRRQPLKVKPETRLIAVTRIE